ncbi:MAG: 2Fe-2S iron-sulfur cluster binding domain-containing protein [Thermoleophilia bacterium]|nr:2Fe-2S iron-sulfur cluster binding domain-containing protein [Thermoleophilia bacterium]
MAATNHKIHVNGGERTLELPGGESLQSALEAAGIYLPSACGGRGICGMCRIRVLSGAPEANPTERHHLSASELGDGIRLGCQIRASGDLDVEIPGTVLLARRYEAEVTGKRRLTHDILELRLGLNDKTAVADRPGQYIRLEVPAQGGPVHRAYSISSTASEKGIVEMIVRLIPDGAGSLYVHGLKKGDRVAFTGPYGDFELTEDPDVEVICVGGGSGMSAVKNVIYTIYERWPDRRCRLFFGCRGQRDVFYLDEFEELARNHPTFSVTYALSEPEAGQPWDGETGFIHLVLDEKLGSGEVRRQAFLCGPPPMVDAAIEVLRQKGIPDSDIYFDKF